LFSHTKITGARMNPAKFTDSWKAEWFVAPSPKKATATSPVLRCFAEIAAPTADGIPPPTSPLVPNRPTVGS
jgi:hypothetical protein